MIICIFCDYVGSGDSIEERWQNVKQHEEKEHSDELKELEE